MLTSELSEVEQDTARAIIDQLQPEFDRCTGNQLRERVRELILAVDPDAVGSGPRRPPSTASSSTPSTPTAPRPCPACTWPRTGPPPRGTTSTPSPPPPRPAATRSNVTSPRLRADVFADLLAGVDPTLAGAATPAPRKGVRSYSAHQHHHPGLPRRRIPARSKASARSSPTSPARPPPRWPNTPSGGSWSRTTTARPWPKAGSSTGPPWPRPDSSTPATAPAGPRAADGRRGAATATTSATTPTQPRNHHRKPVLPVPAPPPGQTRRPVQDPPHRVRHRLDHPPRRHLHRPARTRPTTHPQASRS